MAAAPAIGVELGIPLPPPKTRAPDSFKPGTPGPRRQATVAIRDLANSTIGASVFIADDTYACEPEGIRTAAMRAGGNGWYAIRKIESGWRIWKMHPCSIRAGT
jgi:hypothetical protein